MRHLSISMLVLILVAALFTPAGAQRTGGTAWFGVPLPPGPGDPHRAIVDVSRLAPSPAVVPPGEEGWRDLSGARIYQDVARIVEFSKADAAAGTRAWGRVSGFPSAVAAFEWGAEQLRAAGLRDVAVQQYEGTGTMWTARSWKATLLAVPSLGAGSRPVVLESAIPTGGSFINGGRLTGVLVDTGNTSTELSAVLDVRGKIAVQHVTPASGAYSERGRTTTRAREMSAQGALAVINIVEQTGNMQIRDFSNCGGPCFNLGTADGAFLASVIQKAADARLSGDLRMQLSLEAEALGGLKGQNVVGLVPGRDDRENIIVNAHGDGWFDAAGDNADGLATLLALARHFGKPENRPARTLVFVISGGHHSSGLNGPGHFVQMNPTVTKKTVLAISLEHLSQFVIARDPWRAEANEQAMSLGVSNQSPFLIALGKRGRDRYRFNLNSTFGASVPGDLGGYAPLGIARVQAIHSGPLYHTSGDTLDTISVPGLERAARFFAYFVAEAAKAPRSDINP